MEERSGSGESGTIVAPPVDDILDGKLERVHREAEDDWRHGCSVYEVYHREEDNTYWSVWYRHSTDGEYNGMRDGDYDMNQVRPIQVTVTQYKAIK